MTTTTSRAFNPYASLLGDTIADTNKETAPLKKGEYEELIAKQPLAKKVIIQDAIAILKNLIVQLEKNPLTKGEKANDEAEHFSRSILVALRKDEVDNRIIDPLKLRLYEAYLANIQFQKAIDLYPNLKKAVGERMKGIYVLSDIKSRITGRMNKLEDYFNKTTNAREGLLEVLSHPSMSTTTPDPTLIGRLFHFGTRLPLYYLLAECSDIERGVCGKCDSKSEDYVRRIIGPSMGSIKPELLMRLCYFARKFA